MLQGGYHDDEGREKERGEENKNERERERRRREIKCMGGDICIMMMKKMVENNDVYRVSCMRYLFLDTHIL